MEHDVIDVAVPETAEFSQASDRTEAILDDNLIVIDNIDDTISCDVDALIENGDFDLNFGNDSPNEVFALNDMNQSSLLPISNENLCTLETDLKTQTRSYQNCNNHLNLINNNNNNSNTIDKNFNNAQPVVSAKFETNTLAWNSCNYFQNNTRN